MTRYRLTSIAAVLACACAAHSAERNRTPGDPWEPFNRAVYRVNTQIDRVALLPLSRLSNHLTPGIVGRAVHNFVVNLNEPEVIVNDVLQMRPLSALRATIRLAVNTTVGGLGLIDAAKALHIPPHVNGFGDTLGRWKVGPGPYIYLPIFGPTTVRDLVGMIADDAALPVKSIDYPFRTEVSIGLSVVAGLNERAEAEPDLKALLDGAADPYATLRSAYLQSREAQIRGPDALPVMEDIDSDGSPAADKTAVAKPPAEDRPADPPQAEPKADDLRGLY